MSSPRLISTDAPLGRAHDDVASSSTRAPRSTKTFTPSNAASRDRPDDCGDRGRARDLETTSLTRQME